MADSRYANRGMDFETMIKFANMRYRHEGTAMISKQNTHIKIVRCGNRIVNAIYDEQSTVDFIGHCGGVPVAFDAKQTHSTRIRYDEVQPHQAEFLNDWSKFGGISFVMVDYRAPHCQERIFAVPWSLWNAARALWANRGKSEPMVLTFHGRTWIYNGMASAAADELLPEWEVPPGGAAGMDYLAVALQANIDK